MATKTSTFGVVRNHLNLTQNSTLTTKTEPRIPNPTYHPSNLQIFLNHQPHTFKISQLASPKNFKLSSPAEHIKLFKTLWTWMRQNSHLTDDSIEEMLSEYRTNINHEKNFVKIGRDKNLRNTENLISSIDSKLETLQKRNRDMYTSFEPSTLEASQPKFKKNSSQKENFLGN